MSFTKITRSGWHHGVLEPSDWHDLEEGTPETPESLAESLKALLIESGPGVLSTHGHAHPKLVSARKRPSAACCRPDRANRKRILVLPVMDGSPTGRCPGLPGALRHPQPSPQSFRPTIRQQPPFRNRTRLPSYCGWAKALRGGARRRIASVIQLKLVVSQDGPEVQGPWGGWSGEQVCRGGAGAETSVRAPSRPGRGRAGERRPQEVAESGRAPSPERDPPPPARQIRPQALQHSHPGVRC